MVNVGPAYMKPIDIDFATATLETTAQALINTGYIEDSSATKTPSPAGLVSPTYAKPDATQNLAVTTLTELLTALQNVGLIRNNAGTDPQVFPPGYNKPEEVNFGTVTLAQLLTALGTAGILRDI